MDRSKFLSVASMLLVAVLSAVVNGQVDEPPMPPVPSPPPSTYVPAYDVPRTTAASPSLASLPNMLGDFYFSRGTLCAVVENVEIFESEVSSIVTSTGTVVTDFVGYRTKISENNSPLPQHRVYFLYNHFHNASNTSESARVTSSSGSFDEELFSAERRFSTSLDRYVFGVERTFLDALASVEMRVPFYGTPTQSGSDFFEPSGADFVTGNGQFGNLSFLLKCLLWQSDSWALGGGLGISLPTGSDATGFIRVVDEEAKFHVGNEAVYLSPYLGVIGAPHPLFFYQGFVELNFPTSGNPVSVTSSGAGPTETGVLNEQTWLAVDVAGGVWLYGGEPGDFLTGVASLVELHYTTTLEDADEFVLDGSGNEYKFFSGARRSDVLNVTVGVHVELFQNTTIRAAGVLPLRNGANAPFDSEITISVNRFF